MVPSPTARDLVAYLLVLAVVAVVYVQSDMVSINPLLYLFAYRVFRITSDSGFRAYLVSRTEPPTASVVTAVRLAEGVLIEKKDKTK